MAETENAPPPAATPAGRRRARRKERRTRGNGRDGSVRTPGLRALLFKDLRPSELPANFRQDLKQLYRFYLDEERRAQLAAMGRVRRALLPSRHPQPDGWSLWSFMRPANDVGADLVDYIELPEGRLGVVLGDVAGKGLGAALLTAKLQATLRALVPACPSLSDLGAPMDDILHRDGIDNRFVTLFYLEMRPASGALRFVNAGHNPPFVLRAQATESLMASAIPLGMMAGTTYLEGDLKLEPGDLLVAYSDGLTEARDARDEEFGADRLKALLPGLRGLSAEQAVRVIIDDVNAFLGGERPHDDLSLVVLVRPGGTRPGVVPPPRVIPPPRSV